MLHTKKIFLTIFLAAVLGSVSTVTTAAGKIKNATLEEVTAAIEETITMAEETLEALKNGADQETTLALLKKTKQRHKEIEVTRLGKLKGQASTQMKKARFAAKRGELEKAKEHVAAGVEYYHKLRKKFYDF